jgi:hypothetical protein
MPDPKCSICFDLDYNLFEPEAQFVKVAKPGSLARYRATEFKQLRWAHCPNCNILFEGIGIFWGSYPEKYGVSPFSNLSAYLVLESQPGKPLSALVCSDRKVPLQMVHGRIDFFTPTCQLPNNPYASIYSNA